MTSNVYLIIPTNGDAVTVTCTLAHIESQSAEYQILLFCSAARDAPSVNAKLAGLLSKGTAANHQCHLPPSIIKRAVSVG
jgi:hypothetical protein